jgi:hypothetical protein
MNIYSPHLDEVFESLKTFQPDLISLEQSGNLTPLQFDVPWNKGMSGYTRETNDIEKWKKNISESKRGKPSSMKGKTHSESSKEKNRQSHLGKVFTDEHRQKIRQSTLGKKRVYREDGTFYMK